VFFHQSSDTVVEHRTQRYGLPNSVGTTTHPDLRALVLGVMDGFPNLKICLARRECGRSASHGQGPGGMPNQPEFDDARSYIDRLPAGAGSPADSCPRRRAVPARHSGGRPRGPRHRLAVPRIDAVPWIRAQGWRGRRRPSSRTATGAQAVKLIGWAAADVVALVTGGNTGVGEAVIGRLASEGARVAIGWFEDEEGCHSVRRLAPGPRCTPRCGGTDGEPVSGAPELGASTRGQLSGLHRPCSRPCPIPSRHLLRLKGARMT
jgi:hypothetical protein